MQAPERSPRVPEICAGIAIGIALLALLGWVSDVRFLAGELGTYIPMAPSTALAFLLLSGALFSFAHLPVLRLGRPFELTAVSIVFSIGLLVLVQFIFGINFGIEQVLSRTNELLGSTPLGRMSLLTAIAFLLEGAAFFILLIGERWHNVPTAVALLAAGATTINTVVLIGYAFGVPLLYGGTTIPVALPTAIAFVLVGIGQFNLAAPGIPALLEWSGASIRGILLRAFLPFLLIYILLDSWADLAFAPMTKLNPAVWYSLKVLSAGTLIVITIAWIARRTGGEIERAQKALRDSETRYRNIMERSVEAIYLYGIDTQCVVATNPAFLKILGYRAEEVAGLTIYDIVAADRDSIDRYLRQIVAEGGISMGERLWRRKDGTIIPVEVTANKIQQSEGDLVFVVARDITERKQAEEDQRNYTAFLESLNDITRIVLEAQDMESTLKSLVENIAKLFRADDCFVALWDEVNEKAIPIVAYGSMKDNYSQFVREAGEHKLAASLMKVGHPLAIPDLRYSPYLSPEIASLFPSRAVLGLPLIVQDRKLAALYLGYNENHSFGQTEMSQAEVAAQQIALVLMKIQLFEDAQKRVKQLTVLNEVAIVATRVDTIDRLIECTTEIIGKSLFPDNFGILLMDEEKDVLHPHPSYRFVSAVDLVPTDVSIGQGITGQVAKTGQPIRIGSIAGIQNYLELDQRTSSELCVPIKIKDRVLGVINAESTKTDAFSLDDELLLGTLAGQLATAIEQIRSAQAEHQWFNQLAHSNDLIYALAHITTHIEKALTEEEIIQTLGKELSKIDLICCMATYDKERSRFTINYTSMEPEVLEQMENGIGFPLLKYAFSLEKLNSILNNEDILHPAVIASPENEIQVLFPRRREKGVSEILQGIGLGSEAELLRLPLVFEENLLGILWVWGKSITNADLPIMSIFAKQIGISLERARLFQEVQSLALIDPLTGLQNRRSLFELGRIEFTRSYRMNRPFCCMMLDLDHFKQVNDKYGHLVGDQVLQEFAERCKSSVRAVDLIGRYGGEEFVILLPETVLGTALHVAERLRVSIEKTSIRVSDQELSITVSIGVSTKDENTPDLQTLIARADQAMYVAKYRGRNQVATSK